MRRRLDAVAEAKVVHADAVDWLATGDAEPFDVVFLDPPFDSDLLMPVIAVLADGGWIAPEGQVYVERGGGTPFEVPEGWTLDRDRKAGQVRYHLFTA